MHLAMGVSMAMKDGDGETSLAATKGPSGGFAKEKKMSLEESSRPSLIADKPLRYY
jgi:hypothetical protein